MTYLRPTVVVPVIALLLIAQTWAADEKTDQDQAKARDKQALAKLQDLVGDWSGAGSLRRGSTDGAWIEKAQWSWDFKDNRAALTFQAPKAKYLTAGRLTPTKKAGQYQLIAQRADDKAKMTFVGALDDRGSLTLDADKPVQGMPARILVRTVARGDRLLVSLMKETGGRYLSMARIGYTREGSNFGQSSDPRECIVTGGTGDRKVTYQGETYYVCCKGCLDEFNEDPAGTIAAYKKRKAEEAKEKAE